MIHLGEFLVADEVTFNESRRKVLRLAQDLGFDEIGATRLATAYSELCRLGLGQPGGVRTTLGLRQDFGGLALALGFAYSSKTRAPLLAGAFFRTFTANAGEPGAKWAYEGLAPLPDHTFRPGPEMLEALRNRLAHPSREELLRDLERKNTALEQEIAERKQAEAALRRSEGRTMADPLSETNVFPSMVCQMISVGESTGALDAMLGKIADFYDEEVDQAVENLTAMIEPFMMVFLGVVIGGLVVSMYLPIFKMAGMVGG